MTLLKSTDLSNEGTIASPFQLLHRLYETSDLWLYLLPYCDLRALASLCNCLGRRNSLYFMKYLRELHTGYFNLWPLHNAHTSDFIDEAFMIGLKAFQRSPEMVSKLHSIVFFARGFQEGFPFSPLSFSSSMILLTNLNECLSFAPYSNLQHLTVDMVDESPNHLIRKVSTSKTFISRLQQQLSSGHLAKLATLCLCSPYSNVENTSILELLRCNCPLLERMDLHLNFTVEDFQAFVDPTKTWPSLKELEIGNLIERFLSKLEMDDLFLNQFTDAEEIVMLSVTAALTSTKFPKLKCLEVLSPHDEFTFSFFKALVQQWADGRRYDHIAREGHFVGPQLVSFVFAHPETSRGNQMAWSNQWTNIFKQNKFFTKLSDPTLKRYCLFPNIDQLSFYGDIPSPYLMLLFNCGIGSNFSAKAFQLQVHSKCWTDVTSFLENFHQLDRWVIQDVHFLPARELRSSAKRREVFNVRGYSDVTFRGADGRPLPSDAAIVGETIRQQMLSTNHNGYTSDDEYVDEEVEASGGRIVEALLWGKLEPLQSLGIHRKMLAVVVSSLSNCDHFRNLLPQLTRVTVFMDDLPVSSTNDTLLQLFTTCATWKVTNIRVEVESYSMFVSMKSLVQHWANTSGQHREMNLIVAFDRESWRF